MKKSHRNKQASSNPARRPFTGVPTPVQLAGLVILTWIAYFNSLTGDFVFDDAQIVLQNPALANIKTLGDAFAASAGFRQLLFLTYGLNHYWSAFDSYSYHVVNVALHAINVVLVYFIIKRLTPEAMSRYAAFTGAAVFSVHTLFSSAVSYIAGRSSILCGLFYFAAILLFLRGCETQKRSRGPLWILLSVVCGFLAWQAKQEAITLPVVIAGIVWLRSEKKDWRVIGALAAIPLIAVILLRAQLQALYLTVTENRQLVTAGFETVLLPAAYFRTYLTSIVGYYLPRFVFPASLNADPHIQAVENWYSPEFIVAILILAAIVFVALRYARREQLLAIGIAAILLSPMAAYGLIPLADVVLEHRVYIPGLGVALIFAWAFQRFRQSTGWLGPAIVIVLFTGMTISRNRVWADNIALWEDVAAKSPNKPRAHFNLGAAYQNAKRPADAIREYQRALALKPDIYAAYSNMAAMQLDSGQLDEGEKTLLRLTSLAPDYTDGFINLAVLYIRRRETDKAIEAAQHAVKSNPESFAAEFNLGEALTQSGDFSGALEHYKRSVYLRPDQTSFRLSLGAAYKRAGDSAAAEREFLALLSTEFAADAYRNLATLYGDASEFEKAIESLKHALQIRPVYPEAHHDLGIIYLQRQQLAQAIPEFRATLQQQPDHGAGALNLALAYQLAGDVGSARQTLDEYVRKYGASGSPFVAQAQQRLSALK